MVQIIWAHLTFPSTGTTKNLGWLMTTSCTHPRYMPVQINNSLGNRKLIHSRDSSCLVVCRTAADPLAESPTFLPLYSESLIVPVCNGLNGKLHTDSARCIVTQQGEAHMETPGDSTIPSKTQNYCCLNNLAIVPRFRGIHEYSAGATIPKHPQLGRSKADRERSVLGHDSAGASGS
jgi:hypothetical protein